MKSRRQSDELTLDMFNIPTTRKHTPGSIALGVQISQLIAEVLRNCLHDRIEVAARMSRLTGTEVSINMIDAWAAPSRPDHLPSFERSIAFDIATEGTALLSYYAEILGCKVVMEEDAMLVEIARIEREETELKKKKKFLQERLGDRT